MTSTLGPLWESVASQPVRERDLDRLIPLARELAEKAGEYGCTVSDVRIVAVQRGILTGEERGRRLSFLGKLMPAAGLVATGQYRRSSVDRSHSNLHAVWVERQYAEGAA